MTRQLRIEFPGALYHIYTRGNAKNKIFIDDSDRIRFLRNLKETLDQFHYLCHGYCLMSNHYHILLETPEGNLSSGMHRLNCTYAKYFNCKYDLIGHVFQGRYKSIVVQRENYFLELCRYIVLNPVRAGLVQHPGGYHWSSYNELAGTGLKKAGFLTTDWILSQFSEIIPEAREKFARFVLDGMNTPSPFEHITGDIVLGDKNFLKSLKEIFGEFRDIRDIPRTQRFADRPSLSTLFRNSKCLTKENRNKLIFEACLTFGYSQAAVGKHLGLHYVTISKIIKLRRLNQNKGSQLMFNINQDKEKC